MAIKTDHIVSQPTWFITFTCFKWISLFEITDSYDLVYNWLNFIKIKYEVETLAFVIMPNHVHILIYIEDDTISINTMISNAKRFMAYEIIKRLKSSPTGENAVLLHLLSVNCSEREKAKGQKHKVFATSFDAKEIFSSRFLHQKLDYIHFNPVRGKWNLCDDFVSYPHSSAGFYYSGILHPFIQIRDYRDFWGVVS